jgi:thymidylate synthase ThyX
MIEARMVLDSVNPQGSRLVTMLSRYPKFIHAEHTRHRAFSFSVSSSRAIPVSKNLEEVRSDELRAGPVYWGAEQKGMASGKELDRVRRDMAKNQWRDAAITAAQQGEWMMQLGAHKSIVNRLLEPFLHVNVLVTGTTPGWMNFFGLRLDKAAQPEMRVLAEEMWKVWNESQPTKLESGQWHLPFIDGDTQQDCINYWSSSGDFVDYKGSSPTNNGIRVSVARCARLSYLSFETDKRSTIEEDLKLYDRLVGSSPIHASPAEHQATPDDWREPSFTVPWGNFTHTEQAGNLGPGWRQYRKMLPGEAVAPLPESYL